MHVLVTGADGLLGSNLIRELLERGHEISAFILPGSKSKSLDNLPIQRIYGNILKPEELDQAVAGKDAIVHTAANTNIWPDRSKVVCKVNIEGTENMIAAALKHNIKRFIQIGTANSFGFGSKQNPGHEKNSYQSGKYGLDYMDSKYQAQLVVLKAVKEKGLPALVVNPTFMLGPYDSKPGAGAMILAVYNQQVPGFASGGRNYVYVKDVAIAIANGLTKGKVGECYIAGHQNMDYKEAFTKIASIVNVNPPKFNIPTPFIKLYGKMGSIYGQITKNAPKVSYPMALISCDEHYFTAQKAVEELDMPQTNIDIAIKESFTWLKENGYC